MASISIFCRFCIIHKFKTTAGDAEGGYTAARSVASTVGGCLERQDPRGFEIQVSID